jgi:hypothetical protein
VLRARDEKYVWTTRTKRAHDTKGMNFRPSESDLPRSADGRQAPVVRLCMDTVNAMSLTARLGINCRASQQRYRTAPLPRNTVGSCSRSVAVAAAALDVGTATTLICVVDPDTNLRYSTGPTRHQPQAMQIQIAGSTEAPDYTANTGYLAGAAVSV